MAAIFARGLQAGLLVASVESRLLGDPAVGLEQAFLAGLLGVLSAAGFEVAGTCKPRLPPCFLCGRHT